MNGFKIGDKVILNDTAKAASWYDTKIREIMDITKEGDIVIRPALSDDDFDSFIHPGYLKRYVEPLNVRLEKFYNDNCGI
jgi:hypothetical protein